MQKCSIKASKEKRIKETLNKSISKKEKESKPTE